MQASIGIEVLDRNDATGINAIDSVDGMRTLRGRVDVPDNRDGFEYFLDG
jgi:hypothetical protein